MDDGQGGAFRKLEKPPLARSLLITPVVKGATYKLRYRAMNSMGAGAYSDTAYIVAVSAPSEPSGPVLIASSDDSISLGIPRVSDSGSLREASYELWVSASPWQRVDAYTTNADTFTVRLSDLPATLASGGIYKFKVRALNELGGYTDS